MLVVIITKMSTREDKNEENFPQILKNHKSPIMLQLKYDKKVSDLFENLKESIELLQAVCDIPQGYKLTQTNNHLFTPFVQTWFSLIYRTIFTSDSGISHSKLLVQRYAKIEQTLREFIILDSEHTLVNGTIYLQAIYDLAMQSNTGLNNFTNHPSYRGNANITSPIKFISLVSIPTICSLISDHLDGYRKKGLLDDD